LQAKVSTVAPPTPMASPLVDVASAAATGMGEGALRFWIGKIANMNTPAGVDAVVGEALARFGDGVDASFLDAASARKDELMRRG
jgi:hypothetical protein